MGDYNNDHKDIHMLNNVLDIVSEKVPGLLNRLKETMYSEEAGREMGKAVGSLYKELIQAGIPEKEAIAMARDYMLTFKDMASTQMGSAERENDDGDGQG